MTLQLIFISYGSVPESYEMFRRLTALFMPRQSKSTLITLNSRKSSQDIWLSSLPPAAILIHVPNEILIARYMTLLFNCCPSETCFWACGTSLILSWLSFFDSSMSFNFLSPNLFTKFRKEHWKAVMHLDAVGLTGITRSQDKIRAFNQMKRSNKLPRERSWLINLHVFMLQKPAIIIGLQLTGVKWMLLFFVSVIKHPTFWEKCA